MKRLVTLAERIEQSPLGEWGASVFAALMLASTLAVTHWVIVPFILGLTQ